MTTISARLVAEGVGLPAVWLDPARGYIDGPYEGWRECVLDLPDPQTAFGVALRLDEWERAGGQGHRDGWVARLVRTINGYQGYTMEGFVTALAARLTQIGQDHAIRRAVGWVVAPGTLATLKRRPVAGWSFRDGTHPAYWFDVEEFPALADITDPTEALDAIYHEVCDAR